MIATLFQAISYRLQAIERATAYATPKLEFANSDVA